MGEDGKPNRAERRALASAARKGQVPNVGAAVEKRPGSLRRLVRAIGGSFMHFYAAQFPTWPYTEIMVAQVAIGATIVAGVVFVLIVIDKVR